MSGTEEEKKIYSLQDVQKHDSNKSLWLVIHNRVYDVTKFLDEHPGGEEVLLEQGGQVASEAFEDVGHSEDARDLMKNYYIGDLREDDKEPEFRKDDEDTSEENSKSIWLSWFIPVAVSVGIIAAGMYKSMSS